MIANAAATAAANSLITRSLRLLQEQCAELPLVAAPEEGTHPTAVAVNSAMAGAATTTTHPCEPALPRQSEAATASLASAMIAAAPSPAGTELPAGEPSTTGLASLPALHVRVVTVPPVSPVGGSTPRSALTTAFNLLRTSSDELRAEAAAMAEAVAAAFAQQQAATLAALGLAAPDVASQPATPLPTPVS